MKKIVFFLITCAFGINFAVTASAQKTAVKSDIKAYIDYTPIRSYNIDGYTYVIVEELRSYGFDVVWNDMERTLKIYRNNLQTPIYTEELFNIDNDSVYSSYSIYDTDIKTYLNGEEVNSYNIGGQTVIQIDELAKNGKFEWDPENREVRVMIYETELQKLYDQAENKVEIVISKEPSSKYIGQINSEGIPHGIGYLSENALAAYAGVGYSKTDKILAYFDNGKPKGNIFLDRYIMAGKIGGSLSIKYIGKISSDKTAERRYVIDEKSMSIKEEIRSANFGNVALPYFYMKNYMEQEVFADTNVYTDGVWFEDDGYRGQKGVTFRSWYDGENYQSVLKTNLNEQGKIEKTFLEM